MRPHRFVLLSFVLWASLTGGPSTAPGLSVTDLLDRYATGKFEAVVEELSGEIDFNELLKQLQRDGPTWIGAAGPGARARRELTAATFALEAARTGEWHEWKLIQEPPKMSSRPGGMSSSRERRASTRSVRLTRTRCERSRSARMRCCTSCTWKPPSTMTRR
jgi:hypothetical protein